MTTNFNIDNLKVGDYLSETQYYKVEKINLKTVKLVNESGLEHNFEKELIVEGMYSASLYEEGNLLSSEEIEDKLKKISKELTKGEERTLIGYLFELNTQMGRSLVIDIEITPEQNRIRQIDHRSINCLILKNTKYIVKS